MSEVAQSTTAQSPEHQKVLDKIQALDAALVAGDPNIRGHMAEIHKLLTSYEELVHLLSDDEIGKIIAAQQKLTSTSLVAAVTAKKSSTATAKKAAGISMGDL